MKARYSKNFSDATHSTGKLMLFAGDQKAEHLNDDFFGENIHPDDSDPEHLFRIASQAKIGVFAAQLGLIARYGKNYSLVPYLVKINAKTNLVSSGVRDPVSRLWHTVAQVREFEQETGLKILGIGYSVYPGSYHEPEILAQAASVVSEAHKNGYISVLWIYPRGQSVKNEKDPHLIAGAAGLGVTLGADFVKVNFPSNSGNEDFYAFREAVLAAGRTGVICAGGSSMGKSEFLERLYQQIHISGARGNATGRNIHERSLKEAVQFANAVFAITVEGAEVHEALRYIDSKN